MGIFAILYKGYLRVYFKGYGIFGTPYTSLNNALKIHNVIIPTKITFFYNVNKSHIAGIRMIYTYDWTLQIKEFRALLN